MSNFLGSKVERTRRCEEDSVSECEVVKVRVETTIFHDNILVDIFK